MQPKPHAKPDNLRWNVIHRLAFIDFRLFWEGKINRWHLISHFGVSVNQVSDDLKRYLRLAPGNMAYNASVRSYLPTDEFKPRFGDMHASDYLQHLKVHFDEAARTGPSWVSNSPGFGITPKPVRQLDAHILRAVLEAIRNAEAIEIKYQSLSRPEAIWRWIMPHAFASDRAQWHVRAYCVTNGEFRDFLVGRIIKTRGRKPAEVSCTDDHDWHEEVALEIGAHPGLSEAQKRIIERDYDMRSGRAVVIVRRALLHYTMRQLRLHDEMQAGRTPAEQQITLLNRNEIERCIG